MIGPRKSLVRMVNVSSHQIDLKSLFPPDRSDRIDHLLVHHGGLNAPQGVWRNVAVQQPELFDIERCNSQDSSTYFLTVELVCPDNILILVDCPTDVLHQ